MYIICDFVLVLNLYNDIHLIRKNTPWFVETLSKIKLAFVK